MISYKDTAEYVFDLLECKYKQHYDEIHKIGTENIQVWIPNKLKENLETVSGKYPDAYRGIEIIYTEISHVKLVLKEK
jgi:hypothetical protein